MIILASDYDGTLKPSVRELYLNIHYIKKFRKLGNKFIIATGRSFQSIKAEIERFSIPFDYVVCNDGTISFDGNFQMIKKTCLTQEQMHFLQKKVESKDDIEITHFYTPMKVLDEPTDDSIEVGIKGNSRKSLKSFIHYLNLTEKGLTYFQDGKVAYIKGNTSKSKAIIEISRSLNPDINPKDIYTIGDAGNDLEMLLECNGFRMLESYPVLWNKVWKIVPGESHLIKYLCLKTKRAKNHI